MEKREPFPKTLTSDEVAEYAEGTIENWFTGYTDVLEDGYQRRIKRISTLDDMIVYEIIPCVDGGLDVDKAQRFRVSVQAEEVK